MNERNLKILEQYDMEIKNIRRGRDSYILETGQGVVLLKEYHGSRQRAIWVEKVCQAANQTGIKTDMPIANKEGDFVSCDRDEKKYMLKHWFIGREIDVKNSSEVNQAVDNLAKLHRALAGFQEDGKEKVSRERIFEKRMKELKKIWRYVKDKKRKNSFELSFMQEYGRYLEMCMQALELYGQNSIKEIQEQSWAKGLVCHGDYNQHNVLKEEREIVTVNFENAVIGVQTDDLYDIMRKMLEKHNWKLELAEGMLKTYTRQCPLSKEEYEELYIKFLFPEKFWKIANHYYNSKKTWIPDRSLQKLDKIIAQAPARENFLDYFKHMYLS